MVRAAQSRMLQARRAMDLQPIAQAVEPRILPRDRNRIRVDLAAEHRLLSAFARPMASTPVPVPISTIRSGVGASAGL